MIDFSTVVALDGHHLQEWELSWPTWVKFRPELLQRPLILLLDDASSLEGWRARLGFVQHPDCRLVLVAAPPQCASQREKMLSAFVLLAPQLVNTPWLLKLDTDTVARHQDPTWCAQDRVASQDGALPVFSSPAWHYTKPAAWLTTLEEWGSGHPFLKDFPPLGLNPPPGTRTFRHRRCISWCFFAQTAWCRRVAEQVGPRLPIPSHDTLLWYWAARTGQPFRLEQMKRFGWEHVRPRRLAAVVKSIGEGEQVLAPAIPLPRRNPHMIVFESVLRSLQPRRGAEIGVAAGVLSGHLLEAFPDLTLHLIDPWCTFPSDHPYWRSGDRHARMDEAKKQLVYQQAMQAVAFAGARAVVHKAFSVEAAQSIPDQALDFVFIDGDHSYLGVRSDLEAWFPKVRAGGILAGHDYGHRRDRKGIWGVAKATQEFAAARGLTIHLPGATVWYAWLPAPSERHPATPAVGVVAPNY